MSDELEVIQGQPLALRHELSVEEVIQRINKVHDVMRRAMKEGHHYGTIPGTPKPTLLKPGAELLCVMFRLDPEYASLPARDGKDLTIVSTCTLYHIPTGQRCGAGMGSCSTRESRYAYRQAKRACPKCGAEQINKSKFPPRGKPQEAPGWYCYAKSGGCGQEFAADDPAILEQVTGRVANEDLADQENTILKMANKRSLVAAVLNVTAASDIFTQDLEDGPHEVAVANGAPKPSEIVAKIDGLETTMKRQPETTNQKADRLFPMEDEKAERDAVLAEINGIKQDKGMTEARLLIHAKKITGTDDWKAQDVTVLTEFAKYLRAL